MTAPCYKCEKRHDKCHASCPDYIAYTNERRDMIKKICREKMIEADAMHSPARDQRVKKYTKRR